MRAACRPPQRPHPHHPASSAAEGTNPAVGRGGAATDQPRPAGEKLGREIYSEGIWTSKTSKHSPHWTEVSACFSTAWSSALHDGHENW